ncbi:MAG: TonB-dependent receptor [Deltaproteobacteria bacterium]|nr:TonB-dependent receptor [Deltaproteobacteria bacterium]
MHRLPDLRRKTRASKSTAVGALVVLIAAAGFAEVASAIAPDPPGESTLPERRTPPVLVQALRPADLPEDPSAFTTVIEMEKYQGEAKSVAEILDESVGVQVRRFGGRGDRAEISIRGSTSSQVVVLLDGVRLNTAQTGSVDLSTLPVELLDRIEISRGGGSVQTGSDAIGGVVNLVTRRPGGTPRTTASFSAESFGTFGGSATHSGKWRDIETSLGYSGYHTDGDWDFHSARRETDVGVIESSGPYERVNNESEAHSVLLSLARDLGGWGRISVRDSFLYDSSGRPGPDWLIFGELRGQSLTAHQRRTRNVASAVLDAAGLFDSPVGGSLQVFHRYDRSRFKDSEPPFLEEIDSDNRNHSVGTRLNTDGKWSLGPTEHALSLGGEFRWDLLHAKNAPDYDRRTIGVFLQDEIGVWDRRLRLIPALRMDDTEGFDTEWLPRLGVIVRVFPWFVIKGNVERSYRVPNFDELYFDEGAIRGNPNLKPEEAFNADVGFELGLDAWGPLETGWIEFALFHNDIDESILFQLVGGRVVAATNTGPARIDGLELAGGFRLFGWLGFSGNWTLMDPRYKASGNQLPGRARSEYLLRLELGPPSRVVRLVAERVYTSEIPVTSTGGTSISARAIYGLSLGIDIAQLPFVGEHVPGSELLLSFAVKNLTDRSVRDAAFFPQPGRTFAFTLNWEL